MPQVSQLMRKQAVRDLADMQQSIELSLHSDYQVHFDNARAQICMSKNLMPLIAEYEAAEAELLRAEKRMRAAATAITEAGRKTCSHTRRFPRSSTLDARDTTWDVVTNAVHDTITFVLHDSKKLLRERVAEMRSNFRYNSTLTSDDIMNQLHELRKWPRHLTQYGKRIDGIDLAVQMIEEHEKPA